MAKITRREMLGTIGVGATTVLVVSCGGGGGGDSGPSCSSVTSNIQANHTTGAHTVAVPAADVAAGAMRTYTLVGNPTHMHMVTLSAGDMTMLGQGRTVTLTSTEAEVHMHTITFRCA